MLKDIALQRLEQIDLLPELRLEFQHMIDFAQGRIARDHPWSTVIPTVLRVLDGTEETIGPFMTAWCLLYVTTIRLDQLQDGDPADDSLPTDLHIGAQYNLIFGYYVLASGILDLLPTKHIPTHRLLNMGRLWTDMVLRMAGGQQRYTTGNVPTTCPSQDRCYVCTCLWWYSHVAH